VREACSSGEGGTDASRGYLALSGAMERLWRFGYERRDREVERGVSMAVGHEAIKFWKQFTLRRCRDVYRDGGVTEVR
jgi:hypothetical protein